MNEKTDVYLGYRGLALGRFVTAKYTACVIYSHNLLDLFSYYLLPLSLANCIVAYGGLKTREAVYKTVASKILFSDGLIVDIYCTL